MVRLFRLAGEQAGTGRDIRPVFGGQKHYMFWPRQAVFSVTRNIFGNAKPLARKGMENSSEVVVFYRGHRGPTRNLAIEGCSNALRKKQRISWRKNCHFKEGKEPIAPIIFGGWDRKIPDSIREIGRVFEGLIYQISSLNMLSHAIKRRQSKGTCPLPAFNSAAFRSFITWLRRNLSAIFAGKVLAMCYKLELVCESWAPSARKSLLVIICNKKSDNAGRWKFWNKVEKIFLSSQID